MKEFEEEQKKRQKEEEEQEAKKPPQYLPEIALPPSFDAEAPSYRYRSLDNSQVQFWKVLVVFHWLVFLTFCL